MWALFDLYVNHGPLSVLLTYVVSNSHYVSQTGGGAGAVNVELMGQGIRCNCEAGNYCWIHN